MADHILSLSYGKDSLACLGAIKELGLPLDRIVHAEVWATETIPADLPEMVEFKKYADEIIKRDYGIQVEHFRANNNYEQQFYKTRFNKCLNKECIYGFPTTRGVWCNSKLKMEAIKKATGDKNAIQYVGIAFDEPERHKVLKGNTRSPLVDAKWSELQCKEWCIENKLLSPIYTSSQRGGCWFCHNQSIKQLRLLRKHHPELWDMLLKWDKDSPFPFKANGHTVNDYEKRFAMEEVGFVPKDKTFRWEMLEKPTQISFVFEEEFI